MNTIKLRDVFGDYLVELGNKYKDIIVLDCDLSSSTRTNKFAKEFPKRFFNMGIAEQNMIGTALGFAISGKIPIVSGFSIFITGRGWEFIRMACHDNLNVKIIATHGGLVGEDGSTHNALEDLSIMSIIPNITVMVPADDIELVKMLDYAILHEGPIYIRLPRDSFFRIHNEEYKLLIEEPDVIKEGNDICIITFGSGNNLALNSTIEIEKSCHYSIKIINLSTIKPINEKKLLKEVQNFKGLVFIEEHNLYCGFGSIVSRIISKFNPKLMKFIGINDKFCESGNLKDLSKEYGLNSDNIIKEIKEFIKEL